MGELVERDVALVKLQIMETINAASTRLEMIGIAYAIKRHVDDLVESQIERDREDHWEGLSELDGSD